MKHHKHKFLLFLSVCALLAYSCANTRSQSRHCHSHPNHSPTPAVEVSAAAQDTCCELSYPARQIEVAGTDLFEKQFRIDGFWDVNNSTWKYKITFVPSPNYQTVSQAYVDYVKAFYPCATGTGSHWTVKQGNAGPGHTQRHMARPNFVGFQSLIPNSMAINDPSDFFNLYYDIPTPFPTGGSGAILSINNALSYNEIYHIQYGLWVDGCSLSQEEIDCLNYDGSVNFRVQTSTGPLLVPSLKVETAVLELLDNDGNTLSEREIQIHYTQSEE